jgi:hypothetical protein
MFTFPLEYMHFIFNKCPISPTRVQMQNLALVETKRFTVNTAIHRKIACMVGSVRHTNEHFSWFYLPNNEPLVYTAFIHCQYHTENEKVMKISAAVIFIDLHGFTYEFQAVSSAVFDLVRICSHCHTFPFTSCTLY